MVTDRQDAELATDSERPKQAFSWPRGVKVAYQSFPGLV